MGYCVVHWALITYGSSPILPYHREGLTIRAIWDPERHCCTAGSGDGGGPGGGVLTWTRSRRSTLEHRTLRLRRGWRRRTRTSMRTEIGPSPMLEMQNIQTDVPATSYAGLETPGAAMVVGQVQKTTQHGPTVTFTKATQS